MVELTSCTETTANDRGNQVSSLQKRKELPQTTEQTSYHDDQQMIDMELVGKVRELIKQDYENVKDKYAPNSRYYAEIMDPNSAHSCWRYLKESNLCPEIAVEMIKKAILWRYEFSQTDEPDYVNLVKDFWLYSPTYFSGKTKDDHDVYYVIGRDYQKADVKFRSSVIKFVQTELIAWDRKNRYNQREMTIVFDVSDTGIRNFDLDFMTWMVGVIDYFPCRFHHIYVVGIPLLLRPIVRLIISWLPAKFSTRVYCGTFEELVETNIEPENLPDRVGGSCGDKCKLAPKHVPWLEEVPEMNDPKVIKAMEYTLCSNLTQERREMLRRMQLEFEGKQ